MKKLFRYKEFIESFARILIGAFVIWEIVKIGAMAGNITDWYANDEVLSLVRNSFFCQEGIFLSLTVVALLVAVDTFRLFSFYIKYAFFEYSRKFGVKRIYRIIWLVCICASLLFPFKAYRIMEPYTAAIGQLAHEADINEVFQTLENGKTAVVYITRSGCPQCAEATQELLNILPQTNCSVIHYDTAQDREVNAEKMHELLEMLQVTAVPAVSFWENQMVTTVLEGDFEEVALSEAFEEFLTGKK